MRAQFSQHGLAFLLTLLLLLLMDGVRAAQPTGLFGHHNPALTVSTNGNITNVALRNPELIRQSIVQSGRNSTQFVLTGEPTLMNPGEPALPFVSRLYQIPSFGSIECVVRQAEFTVEQDVDVAPYMADDGEALADDGPTARSEWIPPSPFVVSEPMILRDVRVVQLTLYPLQYNPVTRELRVYSALEADLVPGSEPGRNELTQVHRPSGAYAALYRELVPNLDPAILDDQTTVPGSYLILSRNHPTVLPWVDSLATWKRLCGYEVVVDTQAVWTVAQMRQVIGAAYHNFDPPLEYVAIMGDPQAGGMSMPTHEQDYDHYFADLSDDQLEEIFVGRYSCTSSEQFASALHKLLLYERFPDIADTNWTVRPILWATLEGTGRQNDNAMRWAQTQFERYTNIHSFTSGAGTANNQTVINALNAGTSFYFWMGGWAGQYPAGVPAQLQSTTKLPMVFLLQEWTGTFQSGLSIAEDFLVSGTPQEPRGGVAAVGLMFDYHAPETNVLGTGIIYSLCNLGMNHIGPILSSAKALMVPIMGAGHSRVDLAFRGTNLMGDPSLTIWKDRLQRLSADYPAQIAVGQNCIPIDVVDETGNPVENALIVLLQNGETRARQRTDANGHADVALSAPTAGTLQLCITGTDAAPLLGSVDCSIPDAQLVPTLWILDDDNHNGTQGNSNQIPNPREVIDLNVYLRNVGNANSAGAIVATITTDNPHITFLQSQVAYGTLAPGDSAAGNQAFRLQCDAELADGECIPLRLNITSDIGVTCGLVNIVAQSGMLTFVRSTLSGGDGDDLLEPDETANLAVTIRNFGHAAASAVHGTLITEHGFVHITQSAGTFGNIAPNAEGTNSESLFSLIASPRVPAGTLETFHLIVLDAAAGTDTVTFTLPIGVRTALDATGPDEFGYLAYDDVDTAYAQARSFDWVDAQNLGTDLNIDDVGYEQTAANYSVVRALPFPFVFYGQTFTQITICSNGWAAFGNQNRQDIAINFPLPGQQCPDALLAPFWDDLQTSGALGVWEYYDPAHYRYVIEWLGRSLNTPSDEHFQIVLLDPAFEAARDGNGILIFQYLAIDDVVGNVNDNPYATIGIAAPGGLIGLQCRYANTPAPGTAPLANERAITFTTDGRNFTGQLRGHVLHEFTRQVIPNALVALTLDSVMTDQDGSFAFPVLFTDNYTVTVRAPGFETRTLHDVIVWPDSATDLTIGLIPAAVNSGEPPVAYQFALEQNYPNPFNSSTDIRFSLPAAQTISLDLFNLAGQRVRTLIHQNLNAGEHQVHVDAAGLATGVYLYRLSGSDGQLMRKLILLK